MEQMNFTKRLQLTCEEQGYEEALDLLDKEKIPHVSCTVNVLFEDVLAGLWQTQILKKRALRITETILLAALAGMYLYSFVKNPNYAMGMVLAVICLLILTALWVVPHLEARSTASAYAANTKCFSICLSEAGIFARQGAQCSYFPMDDAMLVYETKQYFNLLIENRRLYVLPKKNFSEEDIHFLTGLFCSKVEGFRQVGL